MSKVKREEGFDLLICLVLDLVTPAVSLSVESTVALFIDISEQLPSTVTMISSVVFLYLLPLLVL